MKELQHDSQQDRHPKVDNREEDTLPKRSGQKKRLPSTHVEANYWNNS